MGVAVVHNEQLKKRESKVLAIVDADTNEVINEADIHAAAQVIRGVADATPLVPSPFMTGRTGSDFLLKLENMQPIGAFKLRGAMNAVAALGPDVAGVTCVSTGNHGRGGAGSQGRKTHGNRSETSTPEMKVPEKMGVSVRAEPT